MQQLLAKLESSIEQQAKDAKLEQDRISTLEKALAQQRPSADQDEKVEKLLLAVAGEKRRAEERAKQMQSLQEQLLEEERRRERSEQQVLAKESQIIELKSRLSEDESLRSASERRLADKDKQLADLQLQLSEALHAQRTCLAGIQEEDGAPQVDVPGVQERLRDEEEKRKAAEEKLQELQQQLAEELTKRQSVQGQLAEKERHIADLQSSQLSGEELERQRAVQGQVIQKEREVCDLQQQLADELSKRREVQYQNIERERLVQKKDRELTELKEALAAERAAAAGGRTQRMEDTPQIVYRTLPGRAADDEVLDGLGLPPGPPLDPQVGVGQPVPMTLNFWQGSHSPAVAARSSLGNGSSSVPPTPGESRTPAHTGGGVPAGLGGGSSMTFSAVSSQPSGNMRSRAYWMPGVPQWSTAAMSPTQATQQAAVNRRLSMASRTFG